MLKPTPNPSVIVKSKQKIMKGSAPIERINFIGFVNSNQIDINKFGKGIYFLEIETDSGIVNKKLILH